MKGKKRWQHKEVLRGMYEDQCLSMREIADVLGTTAPTIKRWMDKFDIQSRDFNIGDVYRGKSRDEAYCKNISSKAKERFKNKKNHPMYGKKHSDKSKDKMSETKKRKNRERKLQKLGDNNE
jgi:hypothetical protein